MYRHTRVSPCPGLVIVARVNKLTSREQLMLPEGSKHQVLRLVEMLVVNEQKSILVSSVFSRLLNKYI